jgi:hypothetical protein
MGATSLMWQLTTLSQPSQLSKVKDVPPGGVASQNCTPAQGTHSPIHIVSYWFETGITLDVMVLQTVWLAQVLPVVTQSCAVPAALQFTVIESLGLLPVNVPIDDGVKDQVKVAAGFTGTW